MSLVAFQAAQSTHLQLYQKLSAPQMFPLLDPRIFITSGRASVVGSLFSKIKEASVFCSSVGKSKTWIVCFESPLLTRVTGLQNTMSKFSKRFQNFLKHALKLTENSQEIISNGVPYGELTDVQVLALGPGCL